MSLDKFGLVFRRRVSLILSFSRLVHASLGLLAIGRRTVVALTRVSAAKLFAFAFTTQYAVLV